MADPISPRLRAHQSTHESGVWYVDWPNTEFGDYAICRGPFAEDRARAIAVAGNAYGQLMKVRAAAASLSREMVAFHASNDQIVYDAPLIQAGYELAAALEATVWMGEVGNG